LTRRRLSRAGSGSQNRTMTTGSANQTPTARDEAAETVEAS